MIPNPAKCRSRIRALRAWISAYPPDPPGEKDSNKRLLLYGVIPDDYDLEGWAKDDEEIEDIGPLGLVENMTLNTWFYQHPDKVCGKEVFTSSREFPLTIKGTKEDCEKVFVRYFGPLISPAAADGTVNLEAEALAANALMDMLELEIS